jgi:hypothetical protein
MNRELRSTSADGRFAVFVSSWEARMSLWVDTPSIVETASGQVIFAFKDINWSLDAIRWQSDSVVSLQLRKYPGNYKRDHFSIVIDLDNKSGVVEEVLISELAEVEAALEAQLGRQQ